MRRRDLASRSRAPSPLPPEARERDGVGAVRSGRRRARWTSRAIPAPVSRDGDARPLGRARHVETVTSAARRGELDRVLDQVRQRLAQPLRIAVDRARLARGLERHMPARRRARAAASTAPSASWSEIDRPRAAARGRPRRRARASAGCRPCGSSGRRPRGRSRAPRARPAVRSRRGGVTSSSARIAASGVRSSCDASATSWRRAATPASSRSSIALSVAGELTDLVARIRRAQALVAAGRCRSRSAFRRIRSTGSSALRTSSQPARGGGGERDRAGDQQQHEDLADRLVDP